MKSVFKGFNLDENGKVDGAYPIFQTKIQEQMETMIKETNERAVKFLSRLNIDPDVLVKQKAEIDRLSFENEQLKQRIGKARITLEIFENTEDNFEEVLCLEQLKELLGDINDKI